MLKFTATMADSGNEYEAVWSNPYRTATGEPPAELSVTSVPLRQRCHTALYPGIDLHRCQLIGANFSDAHLVRANFSDANLTGVDFIGANLTGANLTGVTWDDTSCPDNTYSNYDGGTCVNNLS